MTYASQDGFSGDKNGLEPDGRPPSVFESARVLKTYLPGHPRNKSGSSIECDVITSSRRQLLTNVPVLQRGSSVYSHSPRFIPAETTKDLADPEGAIKLTGDKFGDRYSRLDDLDGESVLIAYQGGSNVDPIIVGSHERGDSELVHDRTHGRLRREVNQGTSAGIDDGGSVFVNVVQARDGEQASVEIQTDAAQTIRVTQGSASFSISADENGQHHVQHGSGTSIVFAPEGYITIRANGDVYLADDSDDSLILTSGIAQLYGGEVVLQENESDSNPATITLTSSGVSIQRNEEELFAVLVDLLETLQTLTGNSGAQITGTPVTSEAAAPVISDMLEPIIDRLKEIGGL